MNWITYHLKGDGSLISGANWLNILRTELVCISYVIIIFTTPIQTWTKMIIIADSRTITLHNPERRGLFNRERTVSETCRFSLLLRYNISHDYTKHAVQQLHTISGAPPPGVGWQSAWNIPNFPPVSFLTWHIDSSTTPVKSLFCISNSSACIKNQQY
jgi:hypothetical protein